MYISTLPWLFSFCCALTSAGLPTLPSPAFGLARDSVPLVSLSDCSLKIQWVRASAQCTGAVAKLADLFDVVGALRKPVDSQQRQRTRSVHVFWNKFACGTVILRNFAAS